MECHQSLYFFSDYYIDLFFSFFIREFMMMTKMKQDGGKCDVFSNRLWS